MGKGLTILDEPTFNAWEKLIVFELVCVSKIGARISSLRVPGQEKLVNWKTENKNSVEMCTAMELIFQLAING